MSADEEKAIEFIQEIIDFLGDDDYQLYTTDRNILITLLNLIKKQQVEIEELEKTLDLFDERKYRKRYLEERRKEQPNLLYPDSDEIYERYYELRNEIEKKDKIINEMAEKITDRTGSCPLDSYDFDLDCDNRCDTDIEYQCWIDYVTKKVEGE